MNYCFIGHVNVEGDTSQLDALRTYLQEAVSLDIDTESNGEGPTDESQVVGVSLDWESLAGGYITEDALQRGAAAFATITACSYFGMSFRNLLAGDAVALSAAETLAECLKQSGNPAIVDVDDDDDDAAEEQRRDEKRGLHPEHEDPAN